MIVFVSVQFSWLEDTDWKPRILFAVVEFDHSMHCSTSRVFGLAIIAFATSMTTMERIRTRIMCLVIIEDGEMLRLRSYAIGFSTCVMVRGREGNRRA
jgi:hypothetical protein